ncbi:unnamed protein product, partial [marine sediment metagenome]
KSMQHAHHWLTLLDAARKTVGEPKKKKSALDKKVKKAPLVTKPKAAKKSKSDTDLFYG